MRTSRARSRSPDSRAPSNARTYSSSRGSSSSGSGRTPRIGDARLDGAAMKFPSFDMERMQSTWEHQVKYDLSESGVEALTLEEITRDQKELMRSKIGYAEGVGREPTRALIAAFHSGSEAKHVVRTTGTSEANFLAVMTLVSAGDEVVVVMPNYMQVHGIAQGLGARVREVWLREEKAWRIDLDALAAAVTERTKLICVCTPNNPTGQVLTRTEIQLLVAIAAKHGTWILSDEVYRGAELDSKESPSFSGRGERIVVTGGLSKVYGLPGLRIGWLVAAEPGEAAPGPPQGITTRRA